MSTEIKVEKGWVHLTTSDDLPARICAANITGVVSISGRNTLARVYFASNSIDVVETGTAIQEALDKWYARPRSPYDRGVSHEG